MKSVKMAKMPNGNENEKRNGENGNAISKMA
jgi:hypothetical protein